MPAKTGLSHGAAAFTTLMIGTVLSKVVWEALPPLAELSLMTISTLQAVTGMSIPTDERFAGTVLVMAGLSFAWGTVYHIGRHG